jgi:hypothetical protein
VNNPAHHRLSLAGRVLMLGLVGALLLAVPSATLARKPGGGSPSGATVVASPNPVAVGGVLTISGSGYSPATQLQVEVVTTVSDGYIYAVSDSAGGFSLQTTISAAGTAKINVWQVGGRRATLMASTSVLVQ